MKTFAEAFIAPLIDRYLLLVIKHADLSEGQLINAAWLHACPVRVEVAP
jgi:hypothetical protein